MKYLILCSRFYISAGIILLIFSRISAKSVNSPCNIGKYRTSDAQCNNLRHSNWGTANSSFLRLLPAAKDELVNKLPPINKIVRNFLPIQRNLSWPSRWSSNALFLMWTELLRLDLSEPIALNGKLRNKATAHLDASFLYNNDHPDFTIKIVNGELIYTPCNEYQHQHYGRCNETSYANELIWLLVKEHNRISDILKAEYPEWDTRTVFEETRRIVTAQVQHITYAEYLPLLLGNNFVKKYNDEKNGESHTNVYDKDVKTGIYLTVNHVFFEMIRYSALNQNFSETLRTTKKSAIMSLLQNSTVNLFNLTAKQINNVLESSRSHRLPFYREWVKFCEKKSRIFETNTSSHLNDNQILIDLIYGPSNEADLLIGELTEKPAPDAYLGSTLACIMQAQFDVIIRGDRFWYTNTNSGHSFTENQLKELQKTTLSNLICSNTNDLEIVGENAFSSYNALSNRLIQCSNLSHLKLTWWKKHNLIKYQDESEIEEAFLKKAIRKAEDDLTRRKQTEYLLWSNKGGVDPKSPIGVAAAFSKPNKNALLLANNSILLEYASNELLNSLNQRSFIVRRKRQLFDGDDSILGISDDLGGDFLQELDISGFLPDAFKNAENNCPTEVGACDPNYPYRSYTGYCNNLRKPNYGKSLTTFTRLLAPAYEDGISKPRQRSVMGISLPSPRLVSSMMHLDISHLDSKYSLMLMQFAQFVDHDITFTPVHRGFFASIPDCRPCDSPITVHPECMPIEVPAGDPYYPQINFTSGQRFCLPFMRSLPGQQRLGSREQINQNSAFLDASQVYGEHACQARQLRSYQGRLNATSSLYGDRELLPQSSLHPECKAPSGYCFIAGDGRASEQPGLTSIHTIFMREHNRLADGLRFLNPHWDDEHLYQEARRVLIAEYQHIVYNEFLPRILGHNAMNLYGISLEPTGQYYKGYSDECNPSIMSEFAAAAFRIGHSLLRPHIPRMSASYQPLEPSILLRDTFFNPDVIYQRHVIDEITRGLLATPVETLDQFITKEITNHLFEDKKIPHSGMDLPALNVQRGRDHGIPSYNEYRAMCNLKRATTWEDFSKELPSDVINRLKRVYPTVDDVDLFPAGISERPLPGGRVGPTFGCIIGIQFRQLRNCDRFWYETANPILRFSPEQLTEIRKATLSKILCDNLDVETSLQRSAFDLPHEENPRFPCHSLPGINLKAWKDAGPNCQFGSRTLMPGQSYLPTPCTSCVCTPQGARCATIRVTDCNKLLQEVGREAVLKDEICSAQCSSFITIKNGEASAIVDRLPPPTSHGRGINFYHAAGLRPPPPSSARVRNPSTRSFKLRDFAIVVG